VIEFQPSSFSRGSYLNVGVTWLWKRKEDVDLGFDFGGRVSLPAGGGFIAYESDEQFAPLARKFAVAAAERMLRQRELVPTVDAAATVLKKSQGDDDPPNLLESIDSGIALGLIGDAAASRKMFARYVDFHESGEDLEWRTEIDDLRYRRALALSELVVDRERFRERIREDVDQARAMLKLEADVELPF
jgi:hypothetical protein